MRYGQTGFRQDYLKCLSTPHCVEAKLLPDTDTLRDRMTLIAYENGLNEGSGFDAAALGVVAVEVSLFSTQVTNFFI
jgi:transcriptional coactivator HFI1/ADA1